MKESLKPGIEFQFEYRVPAGKTVPCLYPESPEFQRMPEVFATGFMVGLIEWACILAVNPHLDWPDEQTVGTHVNLSHCAPTPPGLTVTTKVKLAAVDGRRLSFEIEAADGVDIISRGTHERVIIQADRFTAKAAGKGNA